MFVLVAPPVGGILVAVGSVRCGKPTPTGACQRPVSVAGGPCGVAHPEAVSPTGAPPSGTPVLSGPPPDPLGGDTLPAGWRERHLLAEDPGTPPEVLDAIAGDDHPAIRIRAAGNPSASPATLARMAADHPHVDEGQLFGDPDLRSATSEDVATHRQVRVNLAGNPATPPETLRALGRDVWNAVRKQAAQNAATPPESLSRLAVDAVVGVRASTTVNPMTPPDTLAVLARDQDPRVRSLLASRAGLPAGMLAELANDPSEIVSASARANPDFNGPVAAHAGLISD